MSKETKDLESMTAEFYFSLGYLSAAAKITGDPKDIYSWDDGEPPAQALAECAWTLVDPGDWKIVAALDNQGEPVLIKETETGCVAVAVIGEDSPARIAKVILPPAAGKEEISITESIPGNQVNQWTADSEAEFCEAMKQRFGRGLIRPYGQQSVAKRYAEGEEFQIVAGPISEYGFWLNVLRYNLPEGGEISVENHTVGSADFIDPIY